MLNAQIKGKNFERWVAKDLTKFFNTTVRRTPCSGGLHNLISSDIMCLDRASIVNELHIECKNSQNLSIMAVYDRTKQMAGVGKVPIVIWRKKFRCEPVVAIGYSDFMNYLKEIDDERKKGA